MVEFFWRNFFGGFFWEDFFGGFFWRILLEDFLRGIISEELLSRNYQGIDVFTRFWGNFVSMEGRKEGRNLDP